MKMTMKQLERLVRETVEKMSYGRAKLDENGGNPYMNPEHGFYDRRKGEFIPSARQLANPGLTKAQIRSWQKIRNFY